MATAVYTNLIYKGKNTCLTSDIVAFLSLTFAVTLCAFRSWTLTDELQQRIESLEMSYLYNHPIYCINRVVSDLLPDANIQESALLQVLESAIK